MRKKRTVIKEKTINWERSNSIFIDCYRVRIEYTVDGRMRFYFFNSSEKGDSCIEIKEPIYRVVVYHEKARSFVFSNPFMNPSKRFNFDKQKE